jgi:hypothetical protein
MQGSGNVAKFSCPAWTPTLFATFVENSVLSFAAPSYQFENGRGSNSRWQRHLQSRAASQRAARLWARSHTYKYVAPLGL